MEKSLKKPDSKPDLLPYIILFLSSAAIYLKTVGFGFIPSWDDAEYVIENIYIRDLTAANLKAIFSAPYLSNYAPLHLLSYSADFIFWGLNPAGYHLTNVILHAVNACLAYYLVLRVTKERTAAIFASILFVVHPINVENVAWVSERKTLLTSLFSFLSFISYLKFRENGRPYQYLACIVLFLAAVLSKPLTVVFPLVLFLYELTYGNLKKGWKYIIPLFVLAAIGAAITVFAQVGGKSVLQETLTLEVLFGTVYPTMFPIFWKYIGNILLPVNLSGFYDSALHGVSDPVFMISILGWVLVFILALLKGNSHFRFWFLWFWAWLLPVSNIIPLPVYYADRYMYFPALGLFVMAGLFIARLGKKLGEKPLFALMAAIAVFYGVLAFNRADVWRDELAFWKDTAEKSPGQDKARLNLGYAYEMKGMYQEAEREYLAAVNIYPSQEAVSNLEMVRAKMGYGK